jgi:hypothetical protein
MERFNLKKLNKVKGKEDYHVKIPNRFVTLEKMRISREPRKKILRIIRKCNIIECKSFSQRESRLLHTEAAYAMVHPRVFKTIRSKETSQVTMVTASESNKWG